MLQNHKQVIFFTKMVWLPKERISQNQGQQGCITAEKCCLICCGENRSSGIVIFKKQRTSNCIDSGDLKSSVLCVVSCLEGVEILLTFLI